MDQGSFLLRPQEEQAKQAWAMPNYMATWALGFLLLPLLAGVSARLLLSRPCRTSGEAPRGGRRARGWPWVL
jgi:hypothetical protein